LAEARLAPTVRACPLPTYMRKMGPPRCSGALHASGTQYRTSAGGQLAGRPAEPLTPRGALAGILLFRVPTDLFTRGRIAKSSCLHVERVHRHG